MRVRLPVMTDADEQGTARSYGDAEAMSAVRRVALCSTEQRARLAHWDRELIELGVTTPVAAGSVTGRVGGRRE